MGNDANFTKILDVLKDIHKEFPDLRFGLVVQAAMDSKKKKANLDFHDLSSKEVHSAMVEYQEQVRSVRNNGK